MPRPTSCPPADELLEVLNATSTVEEAARRLGVNRVTLHGWIRERRIERVHGWRLKEGAESAP